MTTLFKSIVIWFVLCISTLGVIAYSDYIAESRKNELDLVRELTRSRLIIEGTVNRYFTMVESLEAFVHANNDLYDPFKNENTEFSIRFSRFTDKLEKGHRSVLSLQLAPQGVVNYVSKPDKNRKAIGHDLLKDDNRRDQVIRTIVDRSTVVAGPLNLIQGGNAIIARKAIFNDSQTFSPKLVVAQGRASTSDTWPNQIPESFWGFATMLIDTDQLFDEFGLHQLSKNYRFALRGRHGLGEEGEIFWGDHSVFNNPDHTTEITLPGGRWVLGIKSKGSLYWHRAIAIITTCILVFISGAYSLYSRQKKLMAETEAKTHSRFLATMSHEIRTPMNGIIGVAEVLKKSDLNAKQIDQLDKILANSKLLLRLVNDILDYSKIDAGNLELEKSPFSLIDVIERAILTIENQANDKGLSICSDINTNLPVNIEGDEIRLLQVLVNLLSNAVKFTEHGEIKISARKIQSKEELIELKVKDSGIGMSEQDLKSIFNPFTQADQSITRKYGGTGLGLVICEKIVLLMKGNISVESEPGRGTTFTIRIPFHQANTNDNISIEVTNKAHTPKPAPTSDSQSTALENKNLKLLVVDDQRMNIEVASMILEEMGYECAKANSAKEALELLAKESFDIIYMDRQMPEIDGLEATRKIRELYDSQTQPWIVALTASARQEEKDEFIEAGANDFMSKPVDFESFNKSIEHYLKR